jgi:hypothetical protein
MTERRIRFPRNRAELDAMTNPDHTPSTDAAAATTEDKPMLTIPHSALAGLVSDAQSLGNVLTQLAFGLGQGHTSIDMDPINGFARSEPGPTAIEKFGLAPKQGYADASGTLHITAAEVCGDIAFVVEGNGWSIACTSIDDGWMESSFYDFDVLREEETDAEGEDPGKTLDRIIDVFVQAPIRVLDLESTSGDPFAHSPSKPLFDRWFPDGGPTAVVESRFNPKWIDPAYDWDRETALSPCTTIVRANRLAQHAGVEWNLPHSEGGSIIGAVVDKIEAILTPAVAHGDFRPDLGRRIALLEAHAFGQDLQEPSEKVVELLLERLGFRLTESDEPRERYWMLEGVEPCVLAEMENGGWSLSRTPAPDEPKAEWIDHARGLSHEDACMRIYLLVAGPDPKMAATNAASRISALAFRMDMGFLHHSPGDVSFMHDQVRGRLGLTSVAGDHGDGVADTEMAAYGRETHR